MYQANKLIPFIQSAQVQGDKEMVALLTKAQELMRLRNYVEKAPLAVRLGWRGKCEELTLEDIL